MGASNYYYLLVYFFKNFSQLPINEANGTTSAIQTFKETEQAASPYTPAISHSMF